MHKIVNGQKVELSAEEEQKILEEREIAKKKDEKARVKLAAKLSKKREILEKLVVILNLNDEEKFLLTEMLDI